jgi:hypothetical protein
MSRRYPGVAKLSTTAVLLLLAAASPSRAEDLDPAKLDQARSVIAEAVLVEQALAQGRVTQAYAAALRQDLQDDLAALKKEPAFAQLAAQAQAALGRRDVPALTALRDRLVRLERSHGRAG